jgi:TPP-dependent 2-oxoacid decarboxylase
MTTMFVTFYQQLIQSNKLKVINTCDEQGAAFAADAYARINGLGAVCVTYCVGGLKIVNATAQAFAEKSPLVVISGAPGINERIKNPLLHHKVRDFDTQQKIFEHITVDSVLKIIHEELLKRLIEYCHQPLDIKDQCTLSCQGIRFQHWCLFIIKSNM